METEARISFEEIKFRETGDTIRGLFLGRYYFDIPAERQLAAGRHRVRLVVAGDGTSTDLFIDIVLPKTPIFVSDVDGTLTSSENVEFLR